MKRPGSKQNADIPSSLNRPFSYAFGAAASALCHQTRCQTVIVIQNALIQQNVSVQNDFTAWSHGETGSNDPAAGSPTATLLRLFLPLTDVHWANSA